MRFGSVPLKYRIQKPDDKTVGQQDERAYQSGPMPEMTYFDRNQRACRENHEVLRPALLHVNAESLSEKNCRIEKRQKTCGAQSAPCQHGLQFMQQKRDSLAVLEQNFVCSPTRQGVYPAGPRVEKKQRDAQDQEQHSLRDFEKSDKLEIANPALAMQYHRVARRFIHSRAGHSPTVAAGVPPAKSPWSQSSRPPLQFSRQ